MTLPTAQQGVITDYTDAVAPPRTLEHLPTIAAERFAVIEARADAAFDSWPTRQKLMAEKDDAEATLSSYLERAGDGADPKEVVRHESGVARTKNALAAFDAQSAGPSADGRAWQATRTSTLRFINSSRNRKLEAVEVKIPSGADAGKLIDDIGDLVRQVQEVEQAPIPLDLAIQQMRDYVDSKSYHGAPVASIEHQLNGRHARARMVSALEIRWPEKRLDAAPLGDELPNVIDMEAIACWAFREAVQEKLEADLEAAYAGYDGPAYAPDERRSRLVELAAQKLDLERQLSETLWARIANGEDATFPGEMDPRAVLGVA